MLLLRQGLLQAVGILFGVLQFLRKLSISCGGLVNAIATKDNMFKRRIARDALCPICLENQETVEHLLFLCPWTKPIWFGAHICSVPNEFNISSLPNWMNDAINHWKANNICDDLRTGQLFYLIWHIWKARNEFVFNTKSPNPMSVLILAKSQALEFLQARTDNRSSNSIATSNWGSTRWRPPRSDTTKVNIDAAYDAITGRGCAGVVCRDARGKVLTVIASRIFAPNALVAEALAMREALQLARSLNLHRVVFESDNTTMVEACKGSKKVREISNVIHDIQFMKQSFEHVGFTWTRKSGNRVAHQNAALGTRNALLGNWVINPPTLIQKLIREDAGFPLKMGA